MNGRITAYIHDNAIRTNFERMRQNVRADSKMVAVIKADGYGHGAVHIAKMVESYEYIWGFAVAAISEAMQLREAGIRKPVLVLGYTFSSDYAYMVKEGIRPAVFTIEMAEEFAAAAREQKMTAPVHIAVDTGMSRIGVKSDMTGVMLAKQISDLEGIQVEGVFTHYARADEYDKTATSEQTALFLQFCNALEQQNVPSFLRHCANSAGIMEIPESHLDLVRAGISIYGIYPSDEVRKDSVVLEPVMELKSHVVYIKTIQEGTSVSYGGTFTAPKEMKIATIPVGYADGYPRSLSGKGWVLINGKKAPILGRVCMDQFMVDVTDIDVRMLDEVTLLGKDGEEEITVYDLDRLSGRFPYEFVCDVGRRVPRKYVD